MAGDTVEATHEDRGTRAERRLWRFAACEFDESQRELRVAGVPVALEAKPIELLLQLLEHAGEVVTKDELLDAVWPGLTVVEGSLATAVSKLRKALGDDDQTLIVTVPRIGYRLVGDVRVIQGTLPSRRALVLAEGDGVPGREQWRLVHRLDSNQATQVWLVEHAKTRERRVFKFTEDAAGLSFLKREATLWRLLRDGLGERPDFVRVLEWNFEAPPFFLESEYGGPDLEAWVERRGGLAAIPVAERVELVAQVARTISAAHEVGVLHKDLKPANILVDESKDGVRQVKVIDFGSGRVLDPARLEALRITNLALTQSIPADVDSRSGSPLYLAPEVVAGHVPTVSADIYALGIVLYQMLAGDFRKPLAAGWEADISDPLLRDDVAMAAAGDPARRLPSAAVLADRLTSLEQRRGERDRLVKAEERARVAERAIERTRARRPWIIAVIATLIIGAGASLLLYRNAVSERDAAQRQQAIAEAVSKFLSVDFFGRSSPYKSGKADETLVGAVNLAAPDIDRRFENEPQVAARLYQVIARALDKRSDWPDARRDYDRAAQLYERAQGPSGTDGIIVRLQRAMMEARSYEAGSLERAKAIIAGEEGRIHAPVPDDLAMWLASAKGMVALIGNDEREALKEFRIALDKSRRLASLDTSDRLDLQQRLAFTLLRLGREAEAEKQFRDIAAAYELQEGSRGPDVLREQLNVAQTLMAQGRHDDVVRETDMLYPRMVATFGADHEMTLQTLATRAQSESALERYDDAIRDDLNLNRLAVAKQGAGSFFAIAGLADASTSQCRSDHVADGIRSAEQAYQSSQKAFGPKAGMTGGTAYALAACLLRASRFDEAGKLLDTIDAQAVAQLAADPDWPANIAVARAQIALAHKNFAEADHQLALAAPAFAHPVAVDPYAKRSYLALRAAVDAAPKR